VECANGASSFWGRNYRYDQLNRIKAAQSYFEGFGEETASTASAEYSETFNFDFNGNITHLQRNGHNAGGIAMDDLKYYYQRTSGGIYDPTTNTPEDGTNKLAFVHDMVAPNEYSGDMESQNQGNYIYDAIGNLIHDEAEQIDIVWNQSGKIVEIRPFDTGANAKPALEFVYDAGGQRVAKIVKPRNTDGSIKSQLHWKETHYVYDAGGQVMAVYERSHLQDGQVYKEILTLSEQHLYGSARLGMRQSNTIVSKRSFTASIEANTGQFINRQVLANQSGNELTPQTTELSSVENNYTIEQAQRVLGMRMYELSNHLGNVLTVISDRKVGVDTWSYTSQVSGGYSLAVGSPNTYLQTTQGTHVQIVSSDGYVDYYTAEIVSSREYSAYGAELPGYSYSASAYRYGFQNQEVDEEFWGGAVSYKYRIEDARLGRFFSVDPLAPKYPHNSPYAFSENRVIDGVELEGQRTNDGNDCIWKGYNGDGSPVEGTEANVTISGTTGGVDWTRSYNSNAESRSGTLTVTQNLQAGAANVYPGPLGAKPAGIGPSGTGTLLFNNAEIHIIGQHSVLWSHSSASGESASDCVSSDCTEGATGSELIQRMLDNRWMKPAEWTSEMNYQRLTQTPQSIQYFALEAYFLPLPKIGLGRFGSGMGLSSVIGTDAITALNASRMVPEAGVYQVLVHGTGEGFIVNGVFTSSKDLARSLLNAGFQRGTPVRLISCNTGVFADGAAYQLSRYLRSPVMAPTNKIRIIEGGGYDILGGGRFRTFFNTKIN